MTIAIIIFIISFFLLAQSGSVLVRASVQLAQFFKMSEYLLAFVLMSFGTSVSELFVGISSAVGGVPEFSLGNIMGANFINLTLVIGIVAFVSNGLSVDSKISKENFWLVSFLAFLPVLLAFDGMISRGDGAVMIIAFGTYIWRVLGEREYFTKLLNGHKILSYAFISKTFKSLFNFFAAIAVLLLSSMALVWSGQEIAGEISLGALSFGIIFVAVGTTLPELVFGLRAATMNHGSMTVGNSLGSVAFNAAFIMGIVSMIRPIEVDIYGLLPIASFLLLAFILFNIFIYRKSDISRRESLVLLAAYIAFIAGEYFYLF